MTSFAEQLRDPRWQKRRLEVLERDQWQCHNCGDAESELHVHHLRYITGRKLWEYGSDDLRTLCRSCHKKETALTRQAKEVLYDALAADADTTVKVIDPILSLIHFDGDSAYYLAAMANDAIYAFMNGAVRSRVLRVLSDAASAMNAIAEEAERGKNQDD